MRILTQRRRVAYTEIRLMVVWVWLMVAAPGYALTNGLALTPPMGWNSWNKFHCNIDEGLIREVADAMVTNGMRAAGYTYINIDDCWQTSRGADGVIVADARRFPSGIPALADYVHARGLKLGLYSCRGTLTCQRAPGSYGYEEIDAATYAAWGVDYLKYDNCHEAPGSDMRHDYEAMGAALQRGGRPIVYSICAWEFQPWMPACGNLWRTTGDIVDQFDNMSSKLDLNDRYARLAGPGRWNDPDMLEVGNGGMTETEYRAHFSLWCIVAAPLIAGNDVRHMTEATRAILTNPEAIAVNQDAAGVQGTRVSRAAGDGGKLDVWVRPLGREGTTVAVALFNQGKSEARMTAGWAEVGLQPGEAAVRDLWTHADLGTFTNAFSAMVPSHGVVLVRIQGAAPTAPGAGTHFISNLPWVSAANGWGPVERDLSVGDAAAGSGRPLTLRGAVFTKGLGVHAEARVQVFLGRRSARFLATVGLDDEVKAPGTVTFEVWGDGDLLWESGLVTRDTANVNVDVEVKGRQMLTLVVTDAGDGKNNDHADWAEARIVVGEERN